jgi:surface protein
MKSITLYITEKLKINKSNKSSYKYHPKTKRALQELLEHLIEERGNEVDFNDIDTSNITDMSELFFGMKNFNGDISKWDVSNVNDMSYMFSGCESFNKPLNDWDVSSVTEMSKMFEECKTFNQDISDWNVSNVKHRWLMFDYCPIEEKYKPKFQ